MFPGPEIERAPVAPPKQYEDWEDEENADEEAIEAEAEYPWGGDGSDLTEPVRAHVEAALVPTEAPYPPPLDQLLHLGDPRAKKDIQARIAALGLTQAHMPDLVRMARDRALNTAWSDTDAVWAPVHAMTALEPLDASPCVPDLIPLFDVDSDWHEMALPSILCQAGAAALEPLRAYLADLTKK